MKQNNRIRKKLTALLLTAMLLTPSVSATDFPDPTPADVGTAIIEPIPTTSPDDTALTAPEPITLIPGDILELNLKLTAQAAGLQAEIAWDPAQLILTEDPLTFTPDFAGGAMIAMINPEPETGSIRLVYLRQDNLSAEDMLVLPLTFRVTDTAVSGETEIIIRELLLADISNTAVNAAAEGLTVTIIGAEPSVTPEATETPVPEATAEPEIPAARLYLELMPAPEATAEPTATPTAAPTATPTVRPAPTPTRPSGHIGGGSSSGSTPTTPQPTAEPAATPEPTIPSISIGGATPAPDHSNAASGKIRLIARTAEDGVLLELLADDVQIGGLQAEIVYNAADAQLIHADFSESFAQNAMIRMVNDSQPGKISLVYTNLNGYTADGSAIFTAQFRCSTADALAFGLTNAKFTGAGADMSATVVTDQQVQYQIQPEDDLDIIEEDGVRIVEIAAGEKFSLTLDPGELIALRIKDHLIPDTLWSSNCEAVTISAEGLAQADFSGVAVLTALDTASGDLLAEGRICVRNAQFGIPMQLLNASFGDVDGELFALSSAIDEAAYAARGISLTFRDGNTLVRFSGLLPEDMTAIPAAAFDLCGNLTEVDIAAKSILTIETGAFSQCRALEKLTLRNPAIKLQDNAVPTEYCSVFVPAESELLTLTTHDSLPIFPISEP